MTALLPQVLHWALALIPVLILLAIFIWFDVFELMSLKEILGLLVLGGLGALAAYPLSGRMLDTLPIGFSNYSRFVAPWIEEAIKAVIVIGLFRFNRIGYKLDAVISGFAIGAGFSVIENIFYLTLFLTWDRRVAGARPRNGGDAWHYRRDLRRHCPRICRARNPRSCIGYDFRLWWFVPGFVAAGFLTLFNQFPAHL